jgi:hypothetical protein
MSIDPEHDGIANDNLSPSYVGENELLRPNPNHRWYYLGNQTVDEVVVFRNGNSKGKGPSELFTNPEIMGKY